MGANIVVIGGGLAGCILAFTLTEKYNQRVSLVDDGYRRCASKVAAGIFNPITGKRMAKTWMEDQIFPAMLSFYKQAEIVLDAKFLHEHTVIKSFDSLSEQNEWVSKTADEGFKSHIQLFSENADLLVAINTHLGGIEVLQSGWLDCITFMNAVKSHFIFKNCFLEGSYQFETNQIISNENISTLPANGIIVNCTGFQAANHPLWSSLPWQLAKGEIITIKTDIKLNHILNHAVFVCPTTEANEYKVGATYIWNDNSNEVSQSGINELETKLKSFYNLPFKILNAEAEVRPTVKNRKPFLGRHPQFSSQYIFNGFGSKTVSMAPYFANHFCEYLLQEADLIKEVNVNQYF